MKTGKAKAEAMDAGDSRPPLEKAISPSGKVHYVASFTSGLWKNGNVGPHRVLPLLCDHRKWIGDYWGQTWSIVDKTMAVTCGSCIRAFDKNQPDNKVIKGVITAKKCGCCGHHELGITTKDKEYIPLKPGTKVEIL